MRTKLFHKIAICVMLLVILAIMPVIGFSSRAITAAYTLVPQPATATALPMPVLTSNPVSPLTTAIAPQIAQLSSTLTTTSSSTPDFRDISFGMSISEVKIRETELLPNELHPGPSAATLSCQNIDIAIGGCPVQFLRYLFNND